MVAKAEPEVAVTAKLRSSATGMTLSSIMCDMAQAPTMGRRRLGPPCNSMTHSGISCAIS